MIDSSPDDKVHVAIGRLAGAALAKAVSPVVVDDDNLLLGPSRAGVRRHHAARARFWGRAPGPELDGELARMEGPPLCVALPPTPGGLLSLCRVCSAALERGRAVEVIQLGASASGTLPPGLDPAAADHVDAGRIAAQLPGAARWSRLETALAASLWRLWCRRSPVAFSRFCATAAPLDPQIAGLGRCHAGFFPRATAQGLLLSRVDELILRHLSREWQTPATVFVRAMKAGSPLVEWLSLLGDLFLAARLRAWARHAQGRTVERRKEPGAGGSAMSAWSFRWSAGAEAILDTLPGVGAAPPLEIGGAVACDPSRPWVARLDAAANPFVAPLGAIRG